MHRKFHGYISNFRLSPKGENQPFIFPSIPSGDGGYKWQGAKFEMRQIHLH